MLESSRRDLPAPPDTERKLYVTGFLAGVGYVLFGAAEGGALPNVVSEEEGPAGGGVNTTRDELGQLGDRACLGRHPLRHARGLPFLIDAVSYLISVSTLRSIRSRFQVSEDRVRAAAIWQDVLEGLRWLLKHPVLRPIALTAGGLQLAISGVGLVVIVSARDHHATASITGLLLAGAGVGGVAGAAVATRPTSNASVSGAPCLPSSGHRPDSGDCSQRRRTLRSQASS